MKTKEEILKHHTNLSVDPKYSNNGDILEAMDEYAKQHVHDFIKWMAGESMIPYSNYHKPEYMYDQFADYLKSLEV